MLADRSGDVRLVMLCRQWTIVYHDMSICLSPWLKVFGAAAHGQIKQTAIALGAICTAAQHRAVQDCLVRQRAACLTANEPAKPAKHRGLGSGQGSTRLVIGQAGRPCSPAVLGLPFFAWQVPTVHNLSLP